MRRELHAQNRRFGSLDLAVARAAVALLRDLGVADLPVPAVDLGVLSGRIRLRWSGRGRELELNFAAAGLSYATRVDQGRQRWSLRGEVREAAAENLASLVAWWQHGPGTRS